MDNNQDIALEEEEEDIGLIENEIQLSNNLNEEEEYQEITTKLYHVLNFAILVSLIASIILIFTFGATEPFNIVRSIFIVCLCIFHLLSILYKIRKNGEINDPFNFFISNSDVHYLVLLMMYAIADLTPILYIFFYIITFLYELLLYLSNNAIIFFGENSSKTSKKIKSFISNSFFNNTPAVLDMLNIIYLLIVSIVRLSFFCLLTLIVFIVDIIMFNYVKSKQYKDVWRNSARWINRNINCLSPIVSIITEIGALSEKMYS